MKRILLIAIAATALWACQKQSESEQTTVISGSIIPVTEGYISLSFESFLDSAKISKEGAFSMSLNPDVSGTGMLIFDNAFTQVYLEPGKSLTLDITPKNFPNNVAFGGELGPVNDYLRLARKLDRNTAITDEELYKLKPDRFIHLTDSIRSLKMQLLKEYVMRYPEIDSAFVTQHKTDVQYAWAIKRLRYPGYSTLLTGKIPKLPDSYHNSYLKQVEINNPNLMISTVFQSFLEEYLDFKQALYQKDNPSINKLWFPESVARFRVIQQEFTDTIVKDYVLFSSINDHLDNFGTDHLETFLTNFQIHCKNEGYKSHIDLKLQNLKKLERGQAAPVFTAIDPEGNTVSLNDYKGSLVYINLWATWSPWSLQEIPWWESLIRKYESRGVKFVSISLDFVKDMNNWKYILDEKKLGGIHLIQDPKSSIWQDQYYISDLPRYLLIDKQGKIISVHAPRPSENMEKVLEQLITKNE